MFAMLGSLLGKAVSAASLFKKTKRAAGIGGKLSTGLRALPGIGGQVVSTVGRVARMPSVQAGVGGAVLGAIIGYSANGDPIYGKRRRGRGFSSRDIRQTRRMFRLINDMSCAMKGVAKKRC